MLDEIYCRGDLNSLITCRRREVRPNADTNYLPEDSGNCYGQTVWDGQKDRVDSEFLEVELLRFTS